jgi:hypothetical protein
MLVLCEAHDQPALWAAAGLEQRVGPVDVVTSPMFAAASGWEHRIRGDVAEFEITLADGRRISSASPTPVLNRLTFLPRQPLMGEDGEDRHYALQEFHALFLSWLSSHPGPMLNRPSPQFLAGHWRHPSAWAVLAAKAGLVTPTYRHAGNGHRPGSSPPSGPLADPSETVLVVDREVVAGPAVPVDALDACRRLARLTGDGLLGITLMPVGGGTWEFVTATPLPDLATGGERLLDVLAATLHEEPIG